MSREPFLRPRLVGERFEGGVIPVEVLRDLAVFQQLLTETAKWCFIRENPDRQRVPRGFADHAELKLASVGEGSAVPELVIDERGGHLPGLGPHADYYRKARLQLHRGILAASRGEDVSPHLPPQVLSLFERCGRSLKAEERIEFGWEGGPSAAVLDLPTRRRLVLASPGVESLTEEAAVRGRIPAWDKQQQTFTLLLADGRRVQGPVTAQDEGEVKKAHDGYRDGPDGVRVFVRGIGQYDRQNRLQELVEVEQLQVLDPLDVGACLDELSLLRDGWLDGRGLALPPDGVAWLAAAFERLFPAELQLPYLYPTAEGGVRAEWPLGRVDASLEIDLVAHTGAWHLLDLDTGREAEHTLTLDEDADWGWLGLALAAEGGLAS